MAESVITFFLNNVNALLLHEAKIFLEVDDQIRSVCQQLEWIRSFLKDADMKRHKYARVNVWVNQIRDVAYDAEDTIETYVLKLQLHLQRNLALRFICIPKKLNAIHALGVQLKVIKARLDDISANRNRYGLEHIQPGESSSSTNVAQKEKRAPIVEEADVVGFEEDAEKLAKALLAGEESPRRSVVSIVGMGGLGKTTLAKYVYRRRDVKDGFQVHAWVYASQEYIVKDLLLSIIKQVSTSCLTRKQEREMDEEALKNKLLENLSGKRYLIVVDDIWVKEAWDLIEKAFPNDENSSRIMLTTRKREVALFANPSRSPHDLHLLDKDESWKLFCKKAFLASSCPTELTQLGEQIVAKAGGLPLAIVVLGGLLSTKQKSHSLWQKVLESANWYLSEGSDQCSLVLTLSYNDLPYYLKSCFLYFGMFPEDEEIEAGNLIRLWVAEGFIQERGNEIMEDVAEDYLEELIQRSMVQDARRGDDGSVEACRIHDLLRDLAIREAKQDRFFELYGSCGSIEACRPRRLTAHLGERNTNPQYCVENIRSLLLCFRGGLEDDIWRSSYGGVKLLRVLDLSSVCLKKLPKEIGGLILLKYLKLGGIKSNKLPDSISNLISLQTLDLSLTLPGLQVTLNMLRNLQQLRHLLTPLFFGGGTSCERDWSSNPFVSNRVDNLRDLQTLETAAGRWMNGSGLEKLTNLRHLRIEGELGRYSKVLSDSLANFHRLRSLRLYDYSPATPLPLVSFSHHIHLTHLELGGPLEKLPNNEDFPPNLAYLCLGLSELKESVEPMAILEKLPNLRALVIQNAYLGKKMTCSKGGFVNLHRLEIWNSLYLEEWIVEEGAMPNLKRLGMWNCHQLKVISDSIKDITALKEVDFRGVPPKITSWWRQPSSSHHGSSSGGGGGANIDVKVT